MRGWCELASKRVNAAIEVVLALLMLFLVLVVWLGVVDRYMMHWQLGWPAELARYLMIWLALLAVSSGISRREHIALTIIVDLFSRRNRQIIMVLMDVVTLLLFITIFWFGISFAIRGEEQQAMIFGTSMLPYFLAIPVGAFFSIVQIILVTLRDIGDHALLANGQELEH